MELRSEVLREFFTMRDAESRAMRIPEPVKTSLSRALSRAAESRAGAEASWMGGAPAVAVRLALEGWSSALEAARSAARPEGDPPPLGDALTELGVSEARRAELLEVDALIARLAIPESDSHITAEHARALPRVDAAVRALIDAVGDRALRPADFVRARRTRAWYAVAVFAALLAGAVIAVRIAWRTTTTASGSYSVKYEPPRVVDGNSETEWLLPDNTAGWVDLNLGRGRPIKQLRLLNAHNYTFNDRGTRQFEIELWDRKRLVKKVEGAFETFTAAPQPMTVPLSSDGEKISRIRINVKSWFHSGGGLAEVWID